MFNSLKICFADCLKFLRADAVVIAFGIEFHSIGAFAENNLSKREILDLGTAKEPFVTDRKFRFVF